MHKRCGFILAVIFLVAFGSYGQQRDIRVNVTDPTGAAVTTAIVRVVPDGGKPAICPAADGAYICVVSADVSIAFEIEAAGFKRFRIVYPARDITCCEYVFVMRVAEIDEAVVTIVRTESSLGDTPESVVVLSTKKIESTAAPTLDDALRQVPGFSIFRRSSSRTANPTTQGVSLRGVGASGASRSVVMLDGVALNDSFGGWVQWNRVSPIAVETVEVLRGGASSIYGSSSLSGAIDVLSRKPENELTVSAEVFGGSQRTISGSGFIGRSFDKWSIDATVGHFQTKGFIPVDLSERGPVDSFAGVSSSNFSGRVALRLGKFGSIFFRPSYFSESRTNGTALQINRTHSRQFALGGDLARNLGIRDGAKTSFEWRIYGGTQVYDQTFSAISADRTTENLTRVQRSPSQNFGFSGQFTTVVKSNTFIAGVEGREIRGSSDEVGLANGFAANLIGSGGRERTAGAFGKDVIGIGKRVVFAGTVRYDGWTNFRGLTTVQNLLTGATTFVQFPDRDENAISPQVSVLIHANDIVSFHASVSRSFRAPTLNELYRGFRVGNVLTTANENLRSERANTFEAGAGFRHKAGKLRATVFLTDIDNAIANVTLSSTPLLITRKRQNAGRTRTAGFELDGETTIRKLEINAGYQFADSRVSEFSSNVALVDNFIPQVPRQQITFQTSYPIDGWTFALQGRVSSAQFDDDLNLFRLEPYFQLDVFISKRFKEKFSFFSAVENLFNSRYSVGRTPVRTVSSPVNARVGIRWK